jgi:hypothetical protein
MVERKPLTTRLQLLVGAFLPSLIYLLSVQLELLVGTPLCGIVGNLTPKPLRRLLWLPSTPLV